MINGASIYSLVIALLAFVPELVCFLIKGRKGMPTILFQGRNLFYFLMSIFSFLGTLVLLLLFSNDYGVIARMLGWLILSHAGLGLILVSWIWFTMHGYELRFLFKKIVVPAHMNVLIVFTVFVPIIFSLNYWAAIPGVIFGVFSMLWSINAYKITKPAIDENIPLREDDDI